MLVSLSLSLSLLLLLSVGGKDTTEDGGGDMDSRLMIPLCHLFYHIIRSAIPGVSEHRHTYRCKPPTFIPALLAFMYRERRRGGSLGRMPLLSWEQKSLFDHGSSWTNRPLQVAGAVSFQPVP